MCLCVCLCLFIEFNEARIRDRNRIEGLMAIMAKEGHPMRKFPWGQFHFRFELMWIDQTLSSLVLVAADGDDGLDSGSVLQTTSPRRGCHDLTGFNTRQSTSITDKYFLWEFGQSLPLIPVVICEQQGRF